MRINPDLQGRLTRIAEGNVGGAKVSGDGSTVVWDQWFGSDWEVMRHKDGETARLTRDSAQDTGVDVSHDGRTVVWERTVGNDPFHPKFHHDVMMWRDGEESVVAGTGVDEFEPRISGDGRTVVYVRDDFYGKTGYYDLYAVKDGKTQVVTSGEGIDRRPRVDETGTRVYFNRLQKGKSDIWLRDEAGAVKRLTWRDGGEYDPAISADGKVLAWSQKDNEKDHTLYVYDTVGGNPTVVFAQPGESATEPVLNGDGSRVAFTRRGHGEVQVCLAEAGQVKPVILDAPTFQPHMSRDGKVLVFAAVEPEKPGQVAIYKLELDDPGVG